MSENRIKYDKDYWLEMFHSDSGMFSSLVRQIAFGGIAIIWIFRTELNKQNSTSPQEIIPSDLFAPLALLAGALLMDLIQYLYRTIVTRVLAGSTPDKYGQINSRPWIEFFTWLFFLGKFIFVVVAYFRILCFLT